MAPGKWIAADRSASIMENKMKTVVFIAAYVLCIVIWMALTTVGMMCAGLLMGMRVVLLQFLCFVWEKENGRFCFHTDRPLFMPNIYMKSEEEKPESFYRAWSAVGFCFGLMLVLLFCFVLQQCFGGTVFSYYTLFSMFVLSLVSLFLRIARTFSSRSADPELLMCREKERKVISGIMKGERPGSFGEELAGEVSLQTDSPLSMRRYVLLQYFHALDKIDYDRARELAAEIAGALPEKAVYPRGYAVFFAEVSFSYAYLERDSARARYYFQKSPTDPAKNMGLDGRRIYAYYLYYVEKDREAALEVIRQGLSVAEEYPLKGNIPMERELLLSLQDRIQGQES